MGSKSSALTKTPTEKFYEKSVIGNDSGGAVGIISDRSFRASGTLASMVRGGSEKDLRPIPRPPLPHQSYRKHGDQGDSCKAHYRHSAGAREGRSDEKRRETLPDAGYLHMSEEEGRCSFNRGYTSAGFAEKVYHLHLRHMGDNDELYFRDYLNGHPEAARQYERLKLSLWKKYEHDRDGYTSAKGAFVARQTSAAKKEYGKSY